jgi:hypothetical protein
MNARGRIATLMMSVLSAAALWTGCGQVYPEPSEQAVLDFLRNARLNGRLRVCWPAGQAYVESVMRADAALRNGLTAAAPIQTVDALWPPEDPRWRDKFKPEAVESPARGSHDAEGGPPTATAATEPSRRESASAQALDALASVIEQIPVGLTLDTPESKAAFVRNIWDALAVDGVPLRDHVVQIEALGDLQSRLNERISTCCDRFDRAAAGLAFANEGCQSEVSALYDELAAVLHAREEAFLEHAAAQMAGVHARLATVDKQKQRDEYLLLDNTREYFGRILREGWLKRLDDRIRAARRQLAEHESGRQPLAAAEAAFVKSELERLAERYATLSKRVQAILSPPAPVIR